MLTEFLLSIVHFNSRSNNYADIYSIQIQSTQISLIMEIIITKKFMNIEDQYSCIRFKQFIDVLI